MKEFYEAIKLLCASSSSSSAAAAAAAEAATRVVLTIFILRNVCALLSLSLTN